MGMRFFCTIFLLSIILFASAQKPLTFKEVLKTTKEIAITDSFLIDYSSVEKADLDKNTGTSFFKIIERKEDDSLEEADYSIAGKITTHKDFDILLVCTEKSIIIRSSNNLASLPIDRSIVRELFFVLLDKEGNYKNNFLVAMDYRKKDYEKNITRKISSWIYADLKIIQHTLTESWQSYMIYQPFAKGETKSFNFSMEYRINDYGVFVAYPKYKSN
jgi:hypothetical protein